MAEISLIPEVEPRISLKPEVLPSPLPGGALSTLAAKFSAALGKDSPPPDVLYNAVAEGSEESFRSFLAFRKKMDFQRTKETIISDMVSKRGDREITQFEIDLIRGLSETDVQEAEELGSIMETEYAQQVLNMYLTNAPVDFMLAEEEDSDTAFETLDRVEWVFANQQIALGMAEELDARVGSMSWPRYGWEMVETMIPWKTWTNIRGAVEEMEPTAVLPGNSMREQINYLHTLPPTKFRKATQAALDSIASSNLLDAQQFINAVLTYPESDQFWANAFGYLDIVDTATLGLLAGTKIARGARGSKILNRAKRKANADLGDALEPLARRAKDREVDTPKMLEEAGFIEESAVMRAFGLVKERVFPSNVRNASKLEESVPSIAAPWAIITGSAHLTTPAVNRLRGAAFNRAELLMDVFGKGEKVDRLSEPAEAAALARAVVQVEKEWRHVGHNVLDIRYTAAEDTGADIASATIVFGRKGGLDNFASAAAARGFATKNIASKTADFQVVKHGKGFVVEVTKEVDETQDLVQELMIAGNETPSSSVNTFFGLMRTPKDVTSAVQSSARSVVVHGQTRLIKGFRAILDDIGAVKGRKNRKKLMQLMKANRDAKDVKKGSRGEFYETLPDFESAWLERYNELPPEDVSNAYFAFVQANDFDLIIRDHNWYRAKSRSGIEQITFQGVDFEGKVIDGIPEFDERAGILFDRDGKVSVSRWEFQKAAIRKRIVEMKAEGYEIIQVADANLTLPKSGNKGTYNVSFIVTRDFKRGRVGLVNVERAPGGHKVDRFPFYIKQGRVYKTPSGSNLYSGDVTIVNAHTLKEAKEVARLMNEARLMLKRNDPGLNAFVLANLPYSIKEFRALFTATKKVAAHLDVDSPIAGVPSGRRVSDEMKLEDMFDNFIDTTKSKFNLNTSMSGKFAGERDLENVPILLEEGKVLRVVETDNLIDPLSALNGSISNLLSDVARSDYMIASTNTWITEFQDVLAAPLRELRRDPLAAFSNPVFKESVADRARLTQAKNVHRSIRNFMGYKTETAKKLDFMKAKLAESIYGRFGASGLEMVSESLIAGLNDPFKHMRAMAFHTKLGMFNPVQLVLQAQTLAHVLALSPRNATQGMQAATWHTLLSMSSQSDEMIGHYARMAMNSRTPGTKGWTEEMFREAHEGIRNNGWSMIGGEVAIRDAQEGARVMQGAWGKVLDASPWFFNASERYLRVSAWYTSYFEWRRANPTMRFHRRARASILSRADDMAMNMTTASNASWQRGFLSVPTQFWAYQTRLMEQLLGKRLTFAEKARVYGVYSMVYGVPTGITAPIFFWPGAESIKKELIRRDIDFNDTAFESFTDGLFAVAYEAATGHDLALPERYAPQGLSVFKDFLRGETSLWEFMFGASGAITADIFTSAEPAWKGVQALFSSEENEVFPFVIDDFMAVVSNISSVNNAYKAWMGINTGRWITKNGITLDKVGPWEAVFRGILGASSQAESDAFLQIEILKDSKDFRQQTMKEVTRELAKARRTTDKKTARKHFTRARALMIAGDLNVKEKGQALRRAVGSDETLVDIMEERFREQFLDRQPKEQ